MGKSLVLHKARSFLLLVVVVFCFVFWGGSAVEKYLVLYKARSVFGVLLEMGTLVGKYLVLYKAMFLGGQVVGKSLVLYKARSALGVLLEMGK